jgi:serine/threonine-protein kinase
MGEVMLAATLGLEGAERPVILKTIRSEHRTDQSFKARFLDEARVQAQLEHSGVAKIIEATTDDESSEPYVVVEYVEGRSLGDVRARSLSTGKRVGWHEAVAVAQLIAEALAHVHERRDAQGRPLSIVHRDLSPQNVMVSYEGEIKIIDFGTARGENRRCHTVAGVVFAKPGYTAPEVANGDPGDFRVDLYALGVMLWELCAARRFLQGEASDHMAAVAKNDRNLPPIAALCEAPRGLDEVIERLTSFDRDQRYDRTATAARDLAALLSEAPGLPSGERGVRARVTSLMQRLFEGDAERVRREFLRLVAEARKVFGAVKTPPMPEPQAAEAMRQEAEGLLPGTRYRLGAVLGRGARTVVHEAEHADLGRKVALKMPSADEAQSALAAERIRKEACVLSALNVPGVVRVIDVGRTLDGRPFSVLERCSGTTLDAHIHATDGLPWRDALALADQLLAVLEGVHACGIVHRDLKPANVFVGEGGEITILDFGIAKSERDTSDLDTPPPGRPSVALYGTPEYMAPEQASRPHEADARSDLYAVGTILYEMLTGRLPFTSESAVVLLEQKAQGSPEPPSDRAKMRGIPKEVDDLVLRALARHTSLRFSSATEMRASVAAALAAPERSRARRRLVGAGLVMAALGSAATILAVAAPRYAPEIAAVTESVTGAAAGRGPDPAAPEAAAPAADPLLALQARGMAEPETTETEAPMIAPNDATAAAPIATPAAPAEVEAIEEERAEAPQRPKKAERRKNRSADKKADKTADKADKKKSRKRKGKTPGDRGSKG